MKLYLGIMFGISFDGVDLVLVDFENGVKLMVSDFVFMFEVLWVDLFVLLKLGEILL